MIGAVPACGTQSNPPLEPPPPAENCVQSTPAI
jgi:hypothetical protein